MTLSALLSYTKYGVSLVAALIVFALFGFNLSALLGAALIFAFTKGLLDYWSRAELPPPMVTALFILTFFGLIGGTQFLVFASVIIAAIMMKETKLLRGDPIDAVIVGFKFGALGGFLRLGGILIVPIYEAIKTMRSPWLAFSILASYLLVIWHILGGLMTIEPAALTMSPLEAVFKPLDQGNPLFWVGVIAYEEFLTRATPYGNAWFTLLHFPSRAWLAFRDLRLDPLLSVAFAIFVMAVIHMGTRWLWDTYRSHGIFGSIIGHAIYNATVSASLLVMILLFVVGLIAAFYRPRNFINEGVG